MTAVTIARGAALLALLLAGPAFAADPSAPARDGELRIWTALSGDRISLDGMEYRLRGVTCPDPATKVGRRAKALLNTFLRGGRVVCKVHGVTASCSKEGRDAAAGLIESGVCRARATPEQPGDGRFVMRDTVPLSYGRDGADTTKAACDRGGAGARFQASARAFACSRGVPFSLCEGVTGLRRAGRLVAPSDRFRATGEIAPAFRPFDCR